MLKKIFISLVLGLSLLPAFVLAQTSTTTAAPATTQTQPSAPVFKDVTPTHPNYVAIEYLAGQGILKGYDDGTFKPDQLVNRAEALKVILQGAAVQIPASVTDSSFKDVNVSDWFAVYVMTAKNLGIVNGNPDGSFAPDRNVARAEYVKMLLMANGFKSDAWVGKQLFNDVPSDSWFAPYMNYAGQAGLISKDANNNLYPAQELSRGEVAQILYLTILIRKGNDSQFLLDQTQLQLGQIEVYLNNNELPFAKSSSTLAVDATQQALKNLPNDNIVLGAAKIARAYDYVVNAFISALAKNNTDAKSWANQAITKATEAWQANNNLQSVAHHVKDLANAILAQLPA